MKVQIVGKALVVTSARKVKDIKRAKSICPEALVLKDSDKNTLFTINTSDAKNAGVGSFGANFDSETSGGFAQVTMVMDQTLTKEQLADQYGLAFIRLAQTEEQFGTKFNTASSALAAAVADVEGAE